ncbi:hypothetical protein BDF22DRAFT_620013, partial [Syncephalis plumigaleata]
RIRTLRDGRRVLITPGVEAFLEWASTLYEISVCSLGEQSYVSDVADVLDPNKTRIQGLRHSARPELDFALHRGARDTPPKNLDALYNFCYLPVATPHPSEHGINHLMSILWYATHCDDTTRSWPASQQDNIVVVRERCPQIWSVDLLTWVKEVLGWVHAEFFRRYDRAGLDAVYVVK